MSIGSFGAFGLCIQKDGFAMHSLHILCPLEKTCRCRIHPYWSLPVHLALLAWLPRILFPFQRISILIYLILAQTFRLFLDLLEAYTNAILLFPLRLKHCVLRKMSKFHCFPFEHLRDWAQMAGLQKEHLAKEKFRYLPELCFCIKSSKIVASSHPSHNAPSFR